MGLLKTLAEAGRALQSKELAERANGDEVLVKRVMREFMGCGVFDETGKDTYDMNHLSRELLSEEGSGSMCFLMDVSSLLYQGIRKYQAPQFSVPINSTRLSLAGRYEYRIDIFPMVERTSRAFETVWWVDEGIRRVQAGMA